MAYRAMIACMLCMPIAAAAEPSPSQQLLVALLKQSDLSFFHGSKHPVRVRGEEVINELRAAGVHVEAADAEQELARTTLARTTARLSNGARHPEVIRLNARIAVLTALLEDAANPPKPGE